MTKTLNNLVEKLSVMLYNDKVVVYNSEQIREMFDISDKLLTRYRYDGILPYSRVGDKYWYTQEDIDTFLQNTHKDMSINFFNH